MSEKIFTLHEKWVDEDGCQRTHVVLEDGVLWNSFITQYDADKTCKKLNELSEEIKYLKPLANENSSYMDDMEDDIISFRQQIKKLKNENEELKYQINEQSNEKMGLEENIDRLLKENKELKEENEQSKMMIATLRNIVLEQEDLEKENKELKEKLEDSEFAHRTEMAHHRVAEKELQERNDRQYKQLSGLYRLIEEKDWRALTDIMDDFKKNEKQLQSEWQTYGDME